MIQGLLMVSIMASSVKFLSHSEDIVVFAAASLKDAFTEIGRQYEASHPECSVKLNFAGSQTLSAQIRHGAAADVFASASWDHLLAVKPDQASTFVFAQNKLAVVVPRGQSKLKVFRDLSGARRIVVADASVPAGKYAAACLDRAGKALGKTWLETVQKHVVSRELDVRSVLTKVILGEADAGIVYMSDSIAGKDKVRVVAIPGPWNPWVEYPIAIMPRAENPAGGRRFVQFVLSNKGQEILVTHGFGRAPATRRQKGSKP